MNMNIDELVEAANRQIRAERLRPADPRARAKVTARTVQFYVSKGLLPQPERRGARLIFGQEHVEAIVEVKRQQAAGKVLDDIVNERLRPTINAMTMPPLALQSRIIDPDVARQPADNWLRAVWSPLNSHESEKPGVTFRWHIDLGSQHELSGIGQPPPTDVIEMIQRVLAGSIDSHAYSEEEQ